MGDKNPIHTLGDYSKPSHEGFRNTIELPVGNNVVPLRPDTIQLVQNGCSFHGRRFEDPNQHLKDFLKLVDSLDLDGENRERTRLGPRDTRHCMENPEQAFVEYASLHTDEAGEDDGEVMFIEIIRDDDEPQNEDPNEGEGAMTKEPVVEYFDTFPTRDELAYYRYLMSGPIPSIFLRNPIILEGCPYNLKIPCNIEHVHIEKAYINLKSPLNIMTRMMYNWIMRRKLDPKRNTNRGINNFTGRIKGMHVFFRNFTYVMDFMIVEDISSIIDPGLSKVILGRPFVEISNMTHDPTEGVVRFVRGVDEVAYNIPHKIEQYDLLSDLEKEHTK
ncbi:hypothetical protein Tco_1303586 [Tanacetum coccineum]